MSFPVVSDLIGAIVGVVLSLLILSYVIGDNPAFRFALHLFVGVSAGLAGAVVLRNIIIPHVLLPLLDIGDPVKWAWSLVPLVLGMLLLAKLSARFGQLGNVTMAYLVGVGAAVAIGGAVLGTLFPQVRASAGLLDFTSLLVGTPYDGFVGFINRVVAILGTVATLAYFHFGARTVPNAPAKRNRWIEYAAQAGMVVIAITFGVLFAGVFSSALVALIERLNYFLLFIQAF